MDRRSEFPGTLPRPSAPAVTPHRRLPPGLAVGLVFVLAAILLGVLMYVLPRASFQIEDVEYITTPCDTATQTHQVTATMRIRNTGTANGIAMVRLRIDGSIAKTAGYEIPAQQTVQRGLTATIFDCRGHAVAVELFVPPAEGYGP